MSVHSCQGLVGNLGWYITFIFNYFQFIHFPQSQDLHTIYNSKTIFLWNKFMADISRCSSEGGEKGTASFIDIIAVVFSYDIWALKDTMWEINIKIFKWTSTTLPSRVHICLRDFLDNTIFVFRLLVFKKIHFCNICWGSFPYQFVFWTVIPIICIWQYRNHLFIDECRGGKERKAVDIN